MQENRSNVIMKFLVSGTQVVGFEIGVNKDMIIHKENGYLAKPFDTYDLAEGIAWLLKSDDNKQLSTKARKKVINNFSENVIINKYIKFYETVKL